MVSCITLKKEVPSFSGSSPAHTVCDKGWEEPCYYSTSIFKENFCGKSPLILLKLLFFITRHIFFTMYFVPLISACFVHDDI